MTYMSLALTLVFVRGRQNVLCRDFAAGGFVEDRVAFVFMEKESNCKQVRERS